MSRREWFGCAALLAAGGCAAFAKRPPTPAKDLPPVGLEKAPPGEHYYVIVFGSQSTLKLPRFTHTWATVAHAIEEADGTPSLKEHHTISWLPASLNIQPLYLHPVKAVNLGLHETIEYVQGNGERVSEWGPYECLPRIYLYVHRFFKRRLRAVHQGLSQASAVACSWSALLPSVPWPAS